MYTDQLSKHTEWNTLAVQELGSGYHIGHETTNLSARTSLYRVKPGFHHTGCRRGCNSGPHYTLHCLFLPPNWIRMQWKNPNRLYHNRIPSKLFFPLPPDLTGIGTHGWNILICMSTTTAECSYSSSSHLRPMQFKKGDCTQGQDQREL